MLIWGMFWTQVGPTGTLWRANSRTSDLTDRKLCLYSDGRVTLQTPAGRIDSLLSPPNSEARYLGLNANGHLWVKAEGGRVLYRMTSAVPGTDGMRCELYPGCPGS